MRLPERLGIDPLSLRLLNVFKEGESRSQRAGADQCRHGRSGDPRRRAIGYSERSQPVEPNHRRGQRTLRRLVADHGRFARAARCR